MMESIIKGLECKTGDKWMLLEHNEVMVMVSSHDTKVCNKVQRWWCGYVEVPKELVDEYVQAFDISEITYYKKETDKGCGYKFEKHYPCGMSARKGCVIIGWDYMHIGQEGTTLQDVMADLEEAAGLVFKVAMAHNKEVA